MQGAQPGVRSGGRLWSRASLRSCAGQRDSYAGQSSLLSPQLENRCPGKLVPAGDGAGPGWGVNGARPTALPPPSSGWVGAERAVGEPSWKPVPCSHLSGGSGRPATCMEESGSLPWGVGRPLCWEVGGHSAGCGVAPLRSRLAATSSLWGMPPASSSFIRWAPCGHLAPLPLAQPQSSPPPRTPAPLICGAGLATWSPEPPPQMGRPGEGRGRPQPHVEPGGCASDRPGGSPLGHRCDLGTACAAVILFSNPGLV